MKKVFISALLVLMSIGFAQVLPLDYYIVGECEVEPYAVEFDFPVSQGTCFDIRNSAEVGDVLEAAVNSWFLGFSELLTPVQPWMSFLSDSGSYYSDDLAREAAIYGAMEFPLNGQMVTIHGFLFQGEFIMWLE